MNVVKGVANALSYMHHDSSLLVIHRDISSKNVLFDSEYTAHISDFGTARFVKPDTSNWTSFAGTFGYAAPGIYFSISMTQLQFTCIISILPYQSWNFVLFFPFPFFFYFILLGI